MAQSQYSWIGQTVGSRYQIEAMLGAGGMSTVYRATDPNLRRTVAVKLIHSHLSMDPEFVRRFEQEAAAVAQLRHPNIIQVYDFDHDGDLYYMVLEHMPGETLQSRLKALADFGQRMSSAEVIQIMATICDAVAYAHQRNMIHRDLKPANVMLNPAGQPILMDFGVAKMLGETQHTATGDVIGTAHYMSPEQARGERPDERTDIYSLGVMLFEMVTGRRPFDANTAVSIMMKHLMEPVPDVRQIVKDVPAALVNIIEKALAKSPADRYQSAADMATALRALAQPAPAQPQTESPPTVSMRAPATEGRAPARPEPAAQKRIPVLAAGGIAALAVIALVVFVVLPGAGGPALPSAIGMARIHGGVYLVGLDAPDSDHAPLQQARLEEFWIDLYEVTNAQYAEFVAATGAQAPAGWAGGAPPAGQEQHPVQGVAWDQAAQYCAWVNKRLPGEAEWEVAARGAEGFLYPWGDHERAVDLPRSASYAVGGMSANRSRFGIFDMAGNVWEWVDDVYAPIADGNRVLRGGAYGFLKDMAYRLQGNPNVASMIAMAGLRCAATEVADAGAAGAGTLAPTVVAELPEGVLFQDDFTDPNSGWPIGAQDNYTFGYHPQSFYHLEVAAPNDRFSVFRNLSFADFVAETDVLVDHTGTERGNFQYGLAFRRSGNNYYAFLVSPRAKTWQVVKSTPGGVETLAGGAIDSLRGLQKAPDLLSVEASGSSFVFQINGQTVAQLQDADYASGDAGFIVETLDETLAHIHYADVVVREAGGPAGLFADDFADPASGWPATEGDGFFFGYHPPDFYHVEVNKPNTTSFVQRGLSFADFSAEAGVLVDHTDTGNGNFQYGLTFRHAGDRYYAFVVSPRARTWQLLKQSAAGAQVLAEGAIDSLQGLEKIGDRLHVDASGPNFVARINGVPVAQVADSEFAGGEVGFIVQTFDETLAHVHYDSLAISQPEPIEAAPTAIPAPAATPVPAPEGMALIPAGYFQMGSSTGQANETPEHPVLLDAFYLDVYEVTNAQYKACVDAGACTPSVRLNSFTHAGYRDDPAYASYPVIGVTWDQAISYCSWLARRLPTEAEWEYAAGGPENFVWPWGNAFDAALSAAGAGDTQAVGSYAGGASPFGIHDMAGNVTEWVADVYNEDFYANSPARNPLNTGGGDTRIFRGGSFANRDGSLYTTSRRFIHDRGYNDVDIGFRCAKDAPEENAGMPDAERQALVEEFCRVFTTYKPDAACP